MVAPIPHRAGSALPILDWSRRGLRDEDLSDGGAFVTEFAKLAPRTVWLHGNKLTSASAPQLGRLLSRVPDDALVTRLSLTDNKLGDVGVEALLAALSPQAASSLVSLSLAVNGLGSSSAAVLAHAIGQGSLTSLRELRLNGNAIDDDARSQLTAAAAARTASGGVTFRLQADWSGTCSAAGSTSSEAAAATVSATADPAPAVADPPTLQPVGVTPMVGTSAEDTSEAAASASPAGYAEGADELAAPGLRPVGLTAMVRPAGEAEGAAGPPAELDAEAVAAEAVATEAVAAGEAAADAEGAAAGTPAGAAAVAPFEFFDVDLGERYELGDVLGEGATAIVHRAAPRATREYVTAAGASRSIPGTVAVKTIHRATEDFSLEDVQREIACMRSVSGHPNVLELYEVYHSDASVQLVLMLATGGELFDAIIDRGNFSEAQAATAVRELCSALAQLHAQGIVHRDLKAENVLMHTPPGAPADAEPTLLLTDFGLARPVPTDGTLMTEACGSPAYAAPEVIAGAGYGTCACDMWSVRVIFEPPSPGAVEHACKASGAHALCLLRARVRQKMPSGRPYLSAGD